MARNADFEWFLHKDGRQIGPVTAEELALLALGRHVRPVDLVWCQGFPQWIAISRVLGTDWPFGEAQALKVEPTDGQPTTVPTPRPVPSLAQLYLKHLAARNGGQPLPPVPRSAVPAPAAAPAPIVRQQITSPAATQAIAPQRIWQHADTVPSRSVDAPKARTPSQEPTALWTAPVRSPATTAPQHLSTALMPVEKASSSAGLRLGQGMRENIAHALILVLDRYEIRTVDDLVSNKRLESVAGSAFDSMPLTLRATLGATIGRAALERYLLEMLLSLRARMLNVEHRNVDVRGLVRDMICSGWLEDKIASAYSTTVGALGSYTSGLFASWGREIEAQKEAHQGLERGTPPPLALEYAAGSASAANR